MSKARIAAAATALMGLTAVPAFMIPASAASAPSASPASSSPSSSASTSSGGPLVSVCLTVTPKSVGATVNGQGIVIGPAGVPRTCVWTPF